MIFLLTTEPAVLLISPPAPAVSQHTMVQFNYQMSPIFSSGWENSKTFICQRFREGCKKKQEIKQKCFDGHWGHNLGCDNADQTSPGNYFLRRDQFCESFCRKILLEMAGSGHLAQTHTHP